MEKRAQVVKRVVTAAMVLGVIAFVVGCAPQQPSSGDSAGKPAASNSSSQADWSMSSDCMTCHTTEAKTMASGASGACVHATKSEAKCASCHTDEAGLQKAHQKATATSTMPKRLNKTAITADACKNTQCHNLTDAEFKALTAAVPLVDQRGTTVNQHDVVGLTPGHSDITCGNCHTMHTESTEVDGKAACLSCHHSDVFECNTCH